METEPKIEAMESAMLGFIASELSYGETDTLSRDDDLLVSGLLDSMGVMRLVDFVEDAFDVDIPLASITIENFATVAKLGTFIDSLRKSVA